MVKCRPAAGLMTLPRDLLTCPDCSGILQPARPAWAEALQVAPPPEALNTSPMPWHCPLCGYRVELVELGPSEPPSPAGP